MILEKRWIRLIILLLLSIGCVINVYSAQKFMHPPSDRQRINIDMGWGFFRGDINGEEETHQVNQRVWKPVNLPHEWSIEGPFDPLHNTTQGFLPMEIGWYRKGLKFPEHFEDKKFTSFLMVFTGNPTFG